MDFECNLCIYLLADVGCIVGQRIDRNAAGRLTVMIFGQLFGHFVLVIKRFRTFTKQNPKQGGLTVNFKKMFHAAKLSTNVWFYKRGKCGRLYL